MNLKIGDPAPDFTAPNQDGEVLTLSKEHGKTMVLYFYPKDQTPGCTKEACDFRDNFQRIAAKGITVWGVSVDSVASHKKFHEKYSLNFPLLSDADHIISQVYDTIKSDILGTRDKRITFLLDKDGIIRYIWEDVKVGGHVDAILQKITELGL